MSHIVDVAVLIRRRGGISNDEDYRRASWHWLRCAATPAFPIDSGRLSILSVQRKCATASPNSQGHSWKRK